MNLDQIRSDLAAMGLPVKGATHETGWAERWAAGERLRQMGPVYAQLALAGAGLAEAARKVVEDDHRSLEPGTGPVSLQGAQCSHHRPWYEPCDNCVAEALAGPLEGWERAVKAVLTLDPQAPWARRLETA